MAPRRGGNPLTSLSWASDVLLGSQTSPGVQSPRHREQSQEGNWRTQRSHPEVPLSHWKQQAAPAHGKHSAGYHYPHMNFSPYSVLSPLPPGQRKDLASSGLLREEIINDEDSIQLPISPQVSFYREWQCAKTPSSLHQSFQPLCEAYQQARITPTSQGFHVSCAVCPLESRNQGYESN